MALIELVAGSIITALAGGVWSWRFRRRQVRRPIAIEMEEITSRCRGWQDDLQEIKSVDGDKEEYSSFTTFIPPDDISYESYESNKANIGRLTDDEIRHIKEYYGLVENLHRRLENGGPLQKHALVLMGQIIREHDRIYDYLMRGTLYRLRVELYLFQQ